MSFESEEEIIRLCKELDADDRWMGHNMNMKHVKAYRTATLCMDSNVSIWDASDIAQDI